MLDDNNKYQKLLFGREEPCSKIYIVNTVAGSRTNMDAERADKLKGYLFGSMPVLREGSLTKAKVKSFMHDMRSFMLVGIAEAKNKEEINPFLNTIQIGSSGAKYQLNLACHTLSPTYYHNGNIDAEMLAILYFVGYLNLNLLGNTLQARNRPGRPGRDKGRAHKLNIIESRDDKVDSIYKTLTVENKSMYYFGYSVLSKWGEEELHLGVIRSFCKQRMDGKLIGSWNINYTFHDGNEAGDEEMLNARQFAEGIILACEHGKGGPYLLHAPSIDGRAARAAVRTLFTRAAANPGSIDYTEQDIVSVAQKESSGLSWVPHCDCDPQEPAVRHVCKKKGDNYKKVFYKCRKASRQVQCKYFRWEEHLN
ncbi:MAG: hypothetical protein ACREBR_01805 [bacterium]